MDREPQLRFPSPPLAGKADLMREADLADSVMARGARHLAALAKAGESGARGDASAFVLARDIDPHYAEAFAATLRAGVEASALASELPLLRKLHRLPLHIAIFPPK